MRIWWQDNQTCSGISADVIAEDENGKIDIVRSIKRALDINEFDYLISNDLHYVPASLINRGNMFIVVGHVPVIRLNDDNSYNIIHRKNYMCVDTGAGHRSEGGKMSVYRVEDGTEVYL